jgi:hypothetical protein
MGSVFISYNNSSSIDAFGRARVSQPHTIFDSKLINDDKPLIWDDQEVSGGGTSSTYSANLASSTLAVTAATAGKRVRQTFQRINYQPGKSQLFLLTGTFCNQQEDLTDIITQIGAFDDKNGVFFSYEEGIMYACIRSYATGAAVDTKVAQSDWNVDQFIGKKPADTTLDWTKTQIIAIDMEGLGVGRVRMGFFVNGIIYLAHIFDNTNTIANVYISTPNLPVRYSIESTGTSNVATSMQHISTSVVSEGGREDIGTIHEIDTGVTEITATTGGVVYALLGFRLNASYLDSSIDILQAYILMTSAGVFHWEIRLNPTVAGTFTYSQLTNSGIDWATGSSTNTVTGGKSVAGGHGASSGAGGNASGLTQTDLKNAIRVGAAIDGTQDTMVLVVTALGAAETFLATMTLRELS